MIYLLCPRDGANGFRIFTNYGLMEQIVRKQVGDWCVVYGYELITDEYQMVWVYTKSRAGHLIRSPSKS